MLHPNSSQTFPFFILMKLIRVLLASIAFASVASCYGADTLLVSGPPGSGDFVLAANGATTPFQIETTTPKQVVRAVDDLRTDIERVCGNKPAMQIKAVLPLPRTLVMVGVVGQSPLIDELIAKGKFDAHGLTGAWESFAIAVVPDPFPGVAQALVIAGSDIRGTIYGVYDLSETIGVSPWYWWADVPVVKHSVLAIRAGVYRHGPPSVKYRGIFINDEDWGLQPWAAKTFEPETKDIGPKTYARVCELLLRLKANYLWPAMHPCTKAFNYYPQNKIVADDYGIVMGSSHAEPMLRDNVDEWDVKTRGHWDYSINRDQVLKYWEERVATNARFENIYTLGMRGIHDSGMEGGGALTEKVARLEQIFADQRALLAKYVNPHPEQVPQVFVPYKEVLTLYQNGLKVPDDVTLVWVDDNHGYIRKLSNPEERKRRGGSGVYYHISYWGAPEDYLWIESTPPALIWEEMHKAYEQGSDRVWVVNVGDIKPAEIGMEFFLRMAWDITPWNETAQPAFLTDWANRTFGSTHATEVAGVLEEYYRLNFPAKPEHMYLANFTTNYDERGLRLRRFAALVKKADEIWQVLPIEQKDSFYETVLFPVRGAALLNQIHLSVSFEEAQKAYDQIQVETSYFNEQVASGKWRHIMSSNPRNRPALKKPESNTKKESPPVSKNQSMSPKDEYISFEAEHPSRVSGGAGVSWKVIEGLGRSGDSIALLPTTATIPAEAALEYNFTLDKATNIKVTVYCLPTLPIYSGLRMRYSVSTDKKESQIFDIATVEYSKEWGQNVLRAAAINTTETLSLQAGKHTVKVQPLDPGLVFDKVVIDLGGLKPTHLGPPESITNR